MSGLSSDSDQLEDFFDAIRTPSSQAKYRLSTGSLSGFLTDNSENISVATDISDDDKQFNSSLRGKKTLASKKVQSQVLGSIENKFKMKTPFKSVATPIKTIVFSSTSDSDENLFSSKSKPADLSKVIAAKTPSKSIVFSDSEEETCFDDMKNPPIFVLSSGNESDDFDVISVPSLKSGILPNSTKKLSKTDRHLLENDDSFSSDDDFCSLQDRVSTPKSFTKTKQVEKVRIPSFDSFLIPQNKPSLKHTFRTEKPMRTSKRFCDVKGCFLSSLGLHAKNSTPQFKRTRIELTARLFKLFNTSVFESKLPESLEITWAKRLTKTAGITKCRRIATTQTDSAGIMVSVKKYEASISLSEKVIDCANRLRDTLIHELCHAAVWLLNNSNESHGPFWKSWASKAQRIHPELPPIGRCHNYDIEYKYTYQCLRCAATIGRHSKSIDTAKKACGRCMGKLVLNLPKNADGSLKARGCNPFANFVKDNYKSTKLRIASSTSGVSHRDVMKSLSDQFKSASLS